MNINVETKFNIGDLVYSRATGNGPFEIVAIIIRTTCVYYDLLHRGVRFELPEDSLTRFPDIHYVPPHYFQD